MVSVPGFDPVDIGSTPITRTGKRRRKKGGQEMYYCNKCGQEMLDSGHRCAVPKANASSQLYEVRADVRELLKSIDEYHEAFSVSELEHFSRQKLDAGVKMMRLKNKVSEHFV